MVSFNYSWSFHLRHREDEKPRKKGSHMQSAWRDFFSHRFPTWCAQKRRNDSSSFDRTAVQVEHLALLPRSGGKGFTVSTSFFDPENSIAVCISSIGIPHTGEQAALGTHPVFDGRTHAQMKIFSTKVNLADLAVTSLIPKTCFPCFWRIEEFLPPEPTLASLAMVLIGL